MARRAAKALAPAAAPIPAIYARVSTEEQATSGYGLDVQLERCHAQAIVKGWQIAPAHVFTDEGISGTKDASERPGLAAVLRAVDAGRVNVVIVLSLDRLGRKSKIVLDLVETLTAQTCQLVSCKESLDTSTPTGMFVVQMFAAIAQLDHSSIVKRLSDGRNQRFAHDGERGGPLPFGYIRTAAGIDIDWPAARVVRDIFAWRADGQTLRRIASELSGSFHDGGKSKWYASTVKVILDNEETYRGTRRGSGAAWPTIL